MTTQRDEIFTHRTTVASAARRMAAEGLVVGTAGNLSSRVGDLIAVTATGVVLAEATQEDITVVDLLGNIVDGDLMPTSEIDLHLGIYRQSGTRSVAHTHSTNVVALSLIQDELPCVHYQQLLLGGSVRVAPFAVFGTKELAANVQEALKDKTAALMANHGAIAVGETLDKAIDNTILLEWICEVYLRAHLVGEPRALTVEQQIAVITEVATRGYGKKSITVEEKN